MPTPGIAALKDLLVFSYTVEGGFSATVIKDFATNVNLATGMHNGWTSATPTTVTTMETEIEAAFSVYVTSGPQPGFSVLECMGRGIDEESAVWAASWNGSIHTFIVTSASIKSRILACSPITSNAIDKMAETVADAYLSGFGQEVG